MTSHRDMPSNGDRGLDAFLDAASEQAELESGPARPAFAAVLARARRIDPGLVPAPEPARPGVGLAADERLRMMLAPFVDAARVEAELDVVAHMRTPRPGLPRRRTGSAQAVALIVVIAAAAVVVLALGLLQGREATRLADRPERDQAAAQRELDDPLQASQAAGDANGRRVHRLRSGDAVPEAVEPEIVLDDEAPEDGEPEIVLDDEMDEMDETQEPAASAGSRPRSAKPDALQELDERAAARLAAGDPAGAEALYRQLVRQGGRSSLVDLAYGDLFALVHRRGDRRSQLKLWNEYLGKLPRGRFADDARAGLCRSAAADAQASCWQRYLDDFPGGAYHRQAARALHPD